MNLSTTRKYWNPEIETLGLEELRELQWHRLGPQLAHNFENSPFFRQKFTDMGAEPADIRNWEDFTRLPLMSKDEHRRAQEQGLAEHGDPLAFLNCAPGRAPAML